LSVGDRCRERNDVGVFAVDPGTTLETGLCFLDIAVFECSKSAVDIGGQTILAGHGPCLPRFAIVST
jgi:hypothetical protein